MPGPDENALVSEDVIFITGGNDFGGWRGHALTRYDIAKVRDVRNLGSSEAYYVRCTVRLRVFATSDFDLKHDGSGWTGYPAAVINLARPRIKPGTIELVDYAPKTINTSVSSDNVQVLGSEGSITRQHTTGSASTVTNSFGANLGVNGEGEPTAGLSFEHAEMNETRDERMTARTTGSSRQWSESADMTIKDWAAFAILGQESQPGSKQVRDGGKPFANVVTWVWAQEYPWSAIALRPSRDTGPLAVPRDVQARMTGNGVLQPPSDLSQMGLDFACRATWLVKPGKWSSTGEPTLTVTHDGELWQASHALDSDKVTITPKWTPARSITHTVGLERLSLVPIREGGTANGALITFVKSDFHNCDHAGFTISARAGNLYALGSGFTASWARAQPEPVPASVLVDLAGATPGTLTLYFKVLDLDIEYDLVFKHWITGTVPAVVSVEVNDHPAVRQYVTELEGEGGDSNVTTVALRSLAFGAVDYHDYLQVGMNKIVLTIGANQPGGGKYFLRALAIG